MRNREHRPGDRLRISHSPFRICKGGIGWSRRSGGAGVTDGPDALAFALGGKLAARLVAGGFGSVAAVRTASDVALLAVAGVTAQGLRLIREKAGGPP
jgi:hypothetical protein